MTPKRVAILQSCYIPWKGFFDLLRRVDEFILYDDAQYTKRDWRNRNRIKTPNGPLWLTVPVEVKGNYFDAIKDMRVSDPRWNARHWRSIQANYSRAPYFSRYKIELEALFLGCTSALLSEINFRFISHFRDTLSITTPLKWSMDYAVSGSRTERLVGMCRQAGATEYLTGPAARAYIDEDLFEAAGITLTYMNYQGYPAYEQLYPPFDHHVSIIDLLVHVGPDALAYLLPLPVTAGTERTA
ncbi:MAG: WbqC family protein [Thermoanaerobaculia bacterium]